MLIFPAIDLYDGCAVRLYQGDYKQMTVYSKEPHKVAKAFAHDGAEWIHVVDLEGAKDGTTPNLATVSRIVAESGLQCEVGGGIRCLQTIQAYLEVGVARVILGTAAVTDPDFLQQAVQTYGERIAVGVDLRGGKVAIKGWTQTSDLSADEFCGRLQSLGVKTVICTDISKDGAMRGANHALYRALCSKFSMQFIASGGVSSLADIRALKAQNLYGAIVGKAYYTGAISLPEAIEEAK